MASTEHCHVMMFPWLAFGHMMPSLEFSKRLAAKGVRISFVSTPRNIQRLPSVPSDLANQIKFLELHLPPVDGLPQNCESTVDLQQSEIQYLKKACDNLQKPFEKLLNEDLPDFVLFDFVQCWIPETASKFGVPSAYLSAFSASSLAFIGPPKELKQSSQRTKPGDFTVAPQWFPFPSLIAHRPDQALMIFRNLNFSDESGFSSGERFAKTLEGCDFVAVRSCREFEGDYLNLLERLYQKPVFPIGILPPTLTENKFSHPSFSGIFNWLDKQEKKSVVFVGFGTEYKMPIKEVQELALGIELSQLPYIWILRKAGGADSSDVLPNGFLARTSNRGVVCFGWAPQCEILAHPAIGGCLFHSGWGSVIETLGFGHPQILMPMVADQGLVAKLLVEKGIGFEVERSVDGSFSRDAVAMSLRRVVLEEDGRRLRSEAAKMPTIFAKQDLQDDYTSKFAEFLRNYKVKEHSISAKST